MGKWPDGETALREQRRKARWRGTAGMEQSPMGRCGLPCCTVGREMGNSLFLKRWDSGVGRIFWGSGRWESGLMGKPLYGSREGKHTPGLGMEQPPLGRCGLPCFTAGRKKRNSFFPKGGGGKCFCRRRKNGMTPFPRGGNRAKIGGKTKMRETFLWISKKDWAG